MSGIIQKMSLNSRRPLNTRTVEANERKSATAKAILRPLTWASLAMAVMPKNAPMFCMRSAMEVQKAFSLASLSAEIPEFFRCSVTTEDTIVGWKLPIPQRPMMPALHRARPGPGVFAPAGVGKEGAVGTELDAGNFTGGFRIDPFLRFLETGENEHAQESRCGSDQEHRLPSGEATGEELVGGERGDAHADEGGADVADAGERLEESERRSAGFVRDSVGHQSDGEAEDAADAHAGEEAVNAEIEEPG